MSHTVNGSRDSRQQFESPPGPRARRPAADSERPFDVVIYTDGACSGNPGPGGWACILQHPASGKTRELSGGEAHTTNNRMELMAPIKGLAALKAGRRC